MDSPNLTSPFHECGSPTVQWSVWLSTRLGMLISLALLIIIRATQSVFLADYRRLLAILSFNDLLSCVYVACFPLVNTIQDGSSLFFICNPETDRLLREKLPLLVRFVLMSMSIANTHVLVFLSCLPFFYRYMVLIRDRTPPPCLINTLVCGLVALALTIGWTKMSFGYRQVRDHQVQPELLEDRTAGLYPYVTIHYTPEAQAAYWRVQLLLAALVVCMYAGTAFCYLAVLRLLKARQRARTRALGTSTTSNTGQGNLQRQLSVMMTIQVAIPLVMVIMPYVATYRAAIPSPAITLGTKLVFYWVPCANAILTLLIIRPYRDAFLRFVCGRRLLSDLPVLVPTSSLNSNKI